MKRSKLRKKLKHVARLHAWVSGGLMALYIGLSVIYSPDFFLSDVRDKFRALADDTIAITARVLAPPQKPLVTVAPLCSSGNLSVALDWADDENSVSFDISRDGLPLVTGLTASAYSDTAVVVGTSYLYEVTALGPMGPGSALSDPVVASTPAECVVVFVPTILIGSFDGRWDGNHSTTDRRPEFSGTTNIPNADISILVHSSTIIAAQTTANVNGYWRWEPPIDLPRGAHTIFVTATDPLDASVTVSANLSFRITKKKDDGSAGGGNAVALPPSSVLVIETEESEEQPTESEIETLPGVPFSMTLFLASPEVYQGRSLPFSMTFSDVAESLRGAGAIARYTVIDGSGRERASFFENIVIDEGRTLSSEVVVPPYFKEGKYRLKAEILVDRYNVSRERTFAVVSLPLLSPGGGFVVTYAQFLSRLGAFAFLFLFLLLLWIFVFSREYMLYLHAIRHITERHLARAGFFGNRKGTSY